MTMTEVLHTRPTITALGAEAARETVSELLDDHHLTPLERSDVTMTMRSAHEGGVGVEVLDYSAPVEIRSEGLGYFHLVQVPLCGGSRLRVGATESTGTPATATLPPLEEDFSIVWERDSPHLLLYVDHHELKRVADAASLSSVNPSLLPSELSLRTDAGRSLLHAIRVLHDALDRPEVANGYPLTLASELVMVRLLEAGQVEGTASAAATSQRGEGLFRKFVELAHELVDSGAGVVELAVKLGVPLRTLQDNLRAAAGTTPTALLSDIRMQRAHELLTTSDPTQTTVTQVASRCGFAHLGRFSVEYRRRFGINPAFSLRESAETLARFG